MATEGDMPVMVLLGGALFKKETNKKKKKGKTIQMIFGPLKGALLVICMIEELG
jgi:hypothetical protein